MAVRSVGIRMWGRLYSSTATSAASPPVAAGASVSSGLPAGLAVEDFLKAVGKGVEAHAEKVANEFGSLNDFVNSRSGRFKRLGIACQQRKLIMRFTEKYRRGAWKPKTIKS